MSWTLSDKFVNARGARAIEAPLHSRPTLRTNKSVTVTTLLGSLGGQLGFISLLCPPHLRFPPIEERDGLDALAPDATPI